MHKNALSVCKPVYLRTNTEIRSFQPGKCFLGK